MGLAKLNELYKAVILDNANYPQNKREIENVPKFHMDNPTCGDSIDVFSKVSDGVIDDIAFTGSGCTISQASASIMTTVIKGKKIKKARQLISDFSQLIQGKKISDKAMDELGDAAVIGVVAEFPARIKCAALAWHAADELLNKEGGKDD